MIKVEHEGQEIEVYTADEVQAREAAAATAKENEYKPKLEQATGEVSRLNGIINERAEEFRQFRKLSDEDKAKLSAAERTIYENQEALESERQKNVAAEKARIESARDAAIRKRTGNDDKLFDKVKQAYEVINIEATTPEAIEHRTAMAIGAITSVEPDLVGQLGAFGGGSHAPGGDQGGKDGKKDEGFGATPAGKAFADDLGLQIEPKR